MSRTATALLKRLAKVGAVLILASTTVTLVASTAANAASRPAAMWVWSFSNAAKTVNFATARGISQLFVSVPPQVTASSQLASLRDLSTRARAAGIRVDALGGDPGWVDDPQRVVDNWLIPVLSTRLFTGVHVDIEPYSGDPASPWNTDRAGVVSRYLATLDAMVSAAGPGTPIEADIPFWFNTIGAGPGSTLDREIIARTAGVTIMAYRNHATGIDGVLDVAAPALAAAAALGKPARIGQETNYLGPSAVDRKQTYYGFTRTQMEVQLAQVESGAAAYATYAGLAIHDYTGYAAMRR